jgi:chaperonin GroES
MALQATEGNVIVRPIQDPLVTETGLYLPEQAQKAPTRGHALSIGRKVEGIEEGDVVLFTDFAGSAVRHDGEELFVIDKGNILAVLEGAE